MNDQAQETQTRVDQSHVGQPCEFYDSQGRLHSALITAVHGPQCINLVFVNPVPGQADNYGQKLMRSTSVMHGAIQQAHGMYWLLPGEPRIKLAQPQDTAETPEFAH